MISAVSSSVPVSSGSASNGQTTLSELSKQMSTLQQKLAQTQDPNAKPPNTQEASITREIVSVQAQMERVILEAQLARLNAATGTSSAGQAGAAKAAIDAKGAGGAGTDATADAAGDARTQQSGKTKGTATHEAASKPLASKTASSALAESAALSYQPNRAQGSYLDTEA